MKIFSLILMALPLVSSSAMAKNHENVIRKHTLSVNLDPEELTLTCRMGSNGLSLISLNSPSLERLLEANITLNGTRQPTPQLTSAFLSDSRDCQQNNQDLVEFIVNHKAENIPIKMELSLVEITSSSFGFRRRVLTEAFRVVLDPKLSFGNSQSILLYQEKIEE